MMQSLAPLILIVEDETSIRRFLSVSLMDSGYRVNEAASKAEASQLVRDPVPDMVLLDLGLPDGDGQVLLSELREWYSAPILILSARDQESQKIQALDSGADDYVTKPFGLGELLARIRVLLKRKVAPDNQPTLVHFGQSEVNLVNRTVRSAGRDVHLTPLEYKLLTVLIRHVDKVLTHRFLLREVWGPNDEAEPHYVRVFVASLRRKLEMDPARPVHILTEPGVGYRFVLGDRAEI